MILTNDNYYTAEANMEYMSVSQYKSFLECQERTMAELRGEYKRPTSTALLVGSYVDAWLEGTLDEFCESHPEIYNSRSKEKVLKSDFLVADQVIEAIKNDETLLQYFDGDKQTIMTADIFGVPWKIKMDVYNPFDGFITDLKVMKSLNETYWDKALRRRVGFIENYKYNFQMCIYAMVEKEYTGRKGYLDTYIAALSKESPPDKMVYTGFIQDMDMVKRHINHFLPYFENVKRGFIDPSACGECEYCRSTKKAFLTDYHNILLY